MPRGPAGGTRYRLEELPEAGLDLNAELERLERDLIEMALAWARGSKTKAAELLHVSLDSLRYRIDKPNIA